MEGSGARGSQIGNINEANWEALFLELVWYGRCPFLCQSLGGCLARSDSDKVASPDWAHKAERT